ncbi:MAG: GvpL/GvpF family gas vesicle protein [Bryobacteraceae bacterium]
METERHLDWLYLYGIVRCSAIDLSRVAGVGGSCDVSLVCDGELACAVSPVSRADYSREAMESRAQQLDWLAPRAIRHQQVVLHCLRQTGAVVPLRFGTLCATAGDVRRVLQANQPPFLQLLAFLQGREEWGVKVFANPDLAVQAVEPAEGAGDELAPASPGKAYFMEKKRRKLAQERAILRIAELEGEIYERLLPCAVDARKRRCQDASSDAPQRPVLNAALLVDRDKLSVLQELAGRLEADYRSDGITVELSGPWAPYSFCGDLGQAPAAADMAQDPERCAN